MSTEKTIRDYFAAIHRGGWQDFLAEDMTYGFNSALQDLGKEDYLNGAGNFLAMTIDVDVKHLVIDGDQAAVISDYFVKTPSACRCVQSKIREPRILRWLLPGFYEVVGDDRRLIAVYHQVLHVHINGHRQKITGPIEVVFLAEVLEGAIETVGHVFGQKILPTAPVDGGEVVADGLLGAHMCSRE